MGSDPRIVFKIKKSGASPAVQWLRLHASTARGEGLIPVQGTEILHAAQCGQKKKKKPGFKEMSTRWRNRIGISKRDKRDHPTFEASKDAKNLFLLGFSVRKAVLLI